MQRNKAIILATFFITLLAAIGALMLPSPPTWPAGSVGFHQQLIINIIMATFHTCGAILFISNLDVYTAKLRRAYITLAFGTIITGIATLQISVITVLDGWTTPYAQSGATMLPFVLSGLILYLGARHFARIFGITGFLTRAWVVLPLALVMSALATFLPHIPGHLGELASDVLIAISVWSGTLMLFGGLLVLRVRGQAGAHYTPAMTWLSSALFFGALVLFYAGFYTYINIASILLEFISNIIACISGFLWVRAGYAFALTKYYDEDLPMLRFIFGQSEQRSANQPATVVDMVTHAAGLVSNSQDIDPLLDKVRGITVKLHPGESPSREDNKTLITIYLKIEQYLTTKEAIRHYTIKELRAQLNPNLAKMIAIHESHK